MQRAPLALVLAFLLAACGTAPVHRSGAGRVPARQAQAPRAPWPGQDGLPAAGDIPPDLMNVPDAVPREEPRSALGNPDSYEVYGERYSVLTDFSGFKERGLASWYGTKFQGRTTSSGEFYDMFKMSAAHKRLPIPCYVRVTNLNNGKTAVVRVNDRGPFHSDRIIDLSYVAALKLDIIAEGSAPVEIEALTPELVPPVMTAKAAPAPVAPPTPAAAAPPAPAPIAVATPEPPPAIEPVVVVNIPPPRLPVLAAESARWLQAGAFLDPLNAAALRDQLTGLGIDNVQLKKQLRGSGFLHRVLIGPFPDTFTRDAVRNRLVAAQLPSMPVAE